MKQKKELGIGIHGGSLHNYNITVVVRYETTAGERINKEAVFCVTTEDKETAKKVAIRKAREQLGYFPYIKNASVEVKSRERKIKIL